jgi:anti-sigma regulatory factor (Ser/Thr protein kinase)
MEIAFTEWVSVTDASSVGEGRRTAFSAAQRLGLDETRSGELALLVTEAARNVLVHGGGGQVGIVGMNDGCGPMARILALDRGPGIANLSQAMTDGYSTAGTPGGGLGAMKRIATFLEIFSGKGGTAVMIDLGQTAKIKNLEIAGIAAPIPGERACGDGWSYHAEEGRVLVMLVDGLGHGLGAAEATAEAVATFNARINQAPGRILEDIHDALRKTRGAVAAIAEIRPKQQTMLFVGVGNICCALSTNGGSRSFVSHNGTLGLRTSKIQEFHSDWPADGVLVLHSDGLQSKWDLMSYSGLVARHPAIIGGVLLRDFRRQRDDASVIVVKAA